MKFVEQGNIVEVDYIGRVDNGVFNTSMKKYAKESGVYDKEKIYGPLRFRIGDKNVIGGFNDAVLGMQTGEEKTIAIAPHKAYGHKKKDLVRKYPRAIFESQGVELEPGLTIKLNLRSGTLRANVLELDENNVLLDMNHEYAGKTLIFKIILRDIIK